MIIAQQRSVTDGRPRAKCALCVVLGGEVQPEELVLKWFDVIVRRRLQSHARLLFWGTRFAALIV
eukprot:5457799-Amphidinium_carterae.1